MNTSLDAAKTVIKGVKFNWKIVIVYNEQYRIGKKH